ncbi:hypothetical protein DAETH_26010 [Deinococcus aetherius]|uniref:histidine kinase n=1 Tax=Deinococcus aetherius TaxID=200252 RepID=A0ABN6RGX6_9DEIO|nr:GAF domain-containing protein [Deinococcus aetherius]BDP42632.1 hypothetical protein DAETH_26010 [Deinococcus aetherius]
MSIQPGADAPARVPLSERLQDVTEALAATSTPEDVFSIVLQPALGALNAVAGAVLLVQGERLEVAAAQGDEEGAQTLWQDGPLSDHVPAGDALKGHEALYFEHEGDLTRAYPELEARTGGVAAGATAVLPMFLDEAPLGVIVLDFQEPHRFTPEERRFLRTLASQCAIALGRARLTLDLQRQVQERTRDLTRQNAELEAILNSLPEAVYVGGAGGITRANPVALEMLGFGTLGDLNRNIHLLAEQLQNRNPDTLERLAPEEEAFAIALGGQPHTYDVLVRHLRTGEDRLIRSSAAPIRVDGEVVAAVAINRDLTDSRQMQELRALNARLEERVHERTRELENSNAELVARNRALTAFEELSRDLSLVTDPGALIRRAQGVLYDLLSLSVTAYYEREGDRWYVRSLLGEYGNDELRRAHDGGLPHDRTGSLRVPFETGEPYYQSQYDPRTDHLAEHVPQVAASAMLPLRAGGAVRGVLGLARYGREGWSEVDRTVIETARQSLELALDRGVKSAELDEERAALAAFAALTEAAGAETDVRALARQATEVLRARFPEGSAVYLEPEGERWKVRVWSGDLGEDLVALLTAGVPHKTPALAAAVRERQAVFTNAWDAQRERMALTEAYGSAAHKPMIVDGEVRGVLALGLRGSRQWRERDQLLFRAVGRSLNLALERGERARQLERQNAELAARTRALEGFADLTRDLALHDDPYVLIQRAQEVVLSLLPGGYALYFEPQGERWVKRAQTGDLRSEALQAVADAGLPYHEAGNLLIPYTTLAPYYQDQYAQNTDNIGDLVAHLGASATFPVLLNGRPQGVFAVVLFGKPRPWSSAERAVMETVVRSLGLALERAEGVGELARRTQELARSNAELEQFAYIASHDLQAPIRAVTSFAGVIERKYGEHLDERGRLYLRQITNSGEHMKRLVDDLLAFSRVHTQQREPVLVDAAAVFDEVARRLSAEGGHADAALTRGELPVVLADRQQLDQLLQNLISNGLKYRREGVAPRVHVSAERDGNFWRFSVQDNGIGIEPQYFERIFVIFQRLHGREAFEGTGIGLAVCKKIVERHGGRLWLESTPGHGSTFFFTLPEG